MGDLAHFNDVDDPQQRVRGRLYPHHLQNTTSRLVSESHSRVESSRVESRVAERSSPSRVSSRRPRCQAKSQVKSIYVQRTFLDSQDTPEPCSNIVLYTGHNYVKFNCSLLDTKVINAWNDSPCLCDVTKLSTRWH